MTTRAMSPPRSWQVAANTTFGILKGHLERMMPNLPTVFIVGLSVSAAYLLFKKIITSSDTCDRVNSPKSTKSPGDSDFIASIIEKRERTARKEAIHQSQLKRVDAEVDDDFEDVPDSDEGRKAKSKGSGRRYSHWAGQDRTRKKLAAAKRLEALNKERERRMDSGAEAKEKSAEVL